MLKNNLKLRKYYNINKINTTLLSTNALYLFVNVFFFDKFNRISLSKFLKENNLLYISLLSLKNDKIYNLINNQNFLKNINYCLKLNNFTLLNKQFINMIVNYSLINDNIDFIYLKYPNFKKLININFLLSFFKNNNIKNINIKIIKLLFLKQKNILLLLKQKSNKLI